MRGRWREVAYEGKEEIRGFKNLGQRGSEPVIWLCLPCWGSMTHDSTRKIVILLQSRPPAILHMSQHGRGRLTRMIVLSYDPTSYHAILIVNINPYFLNITNAFCFGTGNMQQSDVRLCIFLSVVFLWMQFSHNDLVCRRRTRIKYLTEDQSLHLIICHPKSARSCGYLCSFSCNFAT